MQLDFLGTLLISLGLTLVLELAFCLIFKIRGVHNLILVVLVNILTNPPVVLINYLLIQNTPVSPIITVLILEAAAFLTEGFCYKHYAENIKRPYLLSFGANTFSYFSGLLILHII